MKSLLTQSAAVVGLLVAASVPTAALAQYKCDQPVTAIDKRACEQAALGPDALRHFVDRTRMILGLDIYNYLRDPQPAMVAANTGDAAKAAKPSTSEESQTRPTETASRAP
jgi:hypothetical protein